MKKRPWPAHAQDSKSASCHTEASALPRDSLHDNAVITVPKERTDFIVLNVPDYRRTIWSAWLLHRYDCRPCYERQQLQKHNTTRHGEGIRTTIVYSMKPATASLFINGLARTGGCGANQSVEMAHFDWHNRRQALTVPHQTLPVRIRNRSTNQVGTET